MKEDEHVRVDGETDMNTKTVDGLRGRMKVPASYHNKTKSYKVGLTVGEEVEIEEDMKGTLKKIGSKVLSKLGHGDDEAMRKDLQRKMGVPQTGKKPTNEEKDDKETPPWDTDKKGASPFKKPHNPNRTGMDSARALAQKAMKKQTKEEVEVDETFKGPEAGSGTGDNPFVTNENSPMNLAKDLAKKSFKKIKQETMMGKIAGGV